MKYKEMHMEDKTFIGVDEVGRGALAGPVFAAAVYVNKDDVGRISGINDSKKLSKKQREALFNEITTTHHWKASFLGNKMIDRINIHKASLMAMHNAVKKLNLISEIVIVDGIFLLPHYKRRQKAHKKADQLFYSVGAASIIAKVLRDRIMERYSKKYLGFSFEKHVGYGTKKHKEEILKNGPTQIHRKTFNFKSLYTN